MDDLSSVDCLLSRRSPKGKWLWGESTVSVLAKLAHLASNMKLDELP